MIIKAKTGKSDLATVYIAEFEENKYIEFVESLEPPYPKNKKWVIIISTLFGCPVKCRFCDSGGFYEGKLNTEQMLEQIDYLITTSFPNKRVNVEKFKLQFARMGEPALNSNVLDVLRQLPELYDAKGLIPSISTIAPCGTEKFFSELKEIKDSLYKERFQLQFSIHSTDEEQRNWLIPVKKWNLNEIAEYGNSFYKKGDRKITLNFAIAEDSIIDVNTISNIFNTENFFIKITPINPTYKAKENNINSLINLQEKNYNIINQFKAAGFDVLLSFGEIEENNIGSNCGQHILNFLKQKKELEKSYTYKLVGLE
ncbi:MAG TPA: radical SAM protein [Candidatus Kapabacteria bacterium]|nr:radical SAM protein [Candidatus Kapabacteria bacterium]HPO61828.1 radical SAM protein [Candidatus Kapabacteria bacterium]